MTHVEIRAGHATDVLARPLTSAEASLVTGYLSLSGIPVLVSVDRGLVHFWPERALTTWEQVQVYRAVKAVSDSPTMWDGRGPA